MILEDIDEKKKTSDLVSDRNCFFKLYSVKFQRMYSLYFERSAENKTAESVRKTIP